MLASVSRRSVAAVLTPLFLASTLFAPGAARAAAAADGRLALLVVPAPDVAPRAASALREAAVRRLAARGVPLAVGGVPSAPDPATLDALRAGLAAGLAAYDILDPLAARARLEAVTAALEADGRLAALAPELLDAPLVLGVVGLGLGEPAAADEAFQRAIRLAPGRSLPPGRFSPAVEEAYALARIRLSAVRPSLLRVGAVPEAVDLFVDGVHRGRTPLAIEPLASGRHLLFAQAPSAGAAAREVEATEFGPDVVDLAVPAGAGAPSLVGLARALAAPERPGPLPPAAARNLGEALDATRLALVWVDGALGGFAAAAGVVDLRTGVWLAVGPVGPVGEAPEAGALGEGLAEAIEAWLASPAPAGRTPALLSDWRTGPPASAPAAAAADGPAAATAGGGAPAGPASAALSGGAPLAVETRPEPDRSWYRRWYWWALIGAAVAGGVAVGLASGGGGGGATGSVSVPGGN